MTQPTVLQELITAVARDEEQDITFGGGGLELPHQLSDEGVGVEHTVVICVYRVREILRGDPVNFAIFENGTARRAREAPWVRTSTRPMGQSVTSAPAFR